MLDGSNFDEAEKLIELAKRAITDERIDPALRRRACLEQSFRKGYAIHKDITSFIAAGRYDLVSLADLVTHVSDVTSIKGKASSRSSLNKALSNSKSSNPDYTKMKDSAVVLDPQWKSGNYILPSEELGKEVIDQSLSVDSNANVGPRQQSANPFIVSSLGKQESSQMPASVPVVARSNYQVSAQALLRQSLVTARISRQLLDAAQLQSSSESKHSAQLGYPIEQPAAVSEEQRIADENLASSSRDATSREEIVHNQVLRVTGSKPANKPSIQRSGKNRSQHRKKIPKSLKRLEKIKKKYQLDED